MNSVQDFLKDKGYNTKAVTQSRKRFERLLEEYAIKYHIEQLNKPCVSGCCCSSCGKKVEPKYNKLCDKCEDEFQNSNYR